MGISRRELLRVTSASGLVAAGMAASEGFLKPLYAQDEPPQVYAQSEVAQAQTVSGEMSYRTLGRTGERVSAIGLGGHHIGRLREEQESIKLIRSAIDRGINFMDNSWDYHNGRSHRWMGQALKDGYRQKVFLMTKIDGRTKGAAMMQIDESLKALQTDRIDLMQHHEIIRMEDPDRIFAPGGAMEAVVEAQKAGKIRYIGFTGHKDPWVYGKGVVDLLGDKQTISGILSFGSRHVSHESPQKAQQEDVSLKWENAWIETKCTAEELAEAGIRPGTRMVVGKHRKRPLRLKDWIASYTLDNKASVAILLALAECLKEPALNVYLVASAKEEVGAIGALYFTQRQPLDALIALEICPLAPEYPIDDGENPVLLVQDGYGVYDEGLNGELRAAAAAADVEVQLAVISGFGSDASIAMKFGHVARAACLAFPTQNTHGFEIAHLGAIGNCASILKAYCEQLSDD